MDVNVNNQNVVTLPDKGLHTNLLKFKYNNDLDQKGKLYRLSNDVITGLLQMEPDSWRIFEQIAKKIDIYPLKLLNSEQFLNDLSEGTAVIPAKYRTVTLRAKDYIKDYQLAASTGYREFTLNALSLFDEMLTNISFSDTRNSVIDVGLSRPISDITFHVQLNQSEMTQIKTVTHQMIKPKGWTQKKAASGDESKHWSAASVSFILHERLAMEMLFLQRYFTRLDSAVTEKLTKPASKLYTLLQMTASSKPVSLEGGWMISLDLEQCNKLSATKYKTITQFANNFKLATELTKKTEYDVIHFKDEASKVKKKYVQLNIAFSKKSAGDLEQKGLKKITRKRLPPRPRVLVGSDAEGAWARKCIAILEAYEKELKTVKRKLIKADRERLVRYRKIIGA
ncbi:hypothetical protein C9I86_13215 [Photobacterium sp. NCIMB 13483]|uniref:Replication initiation protein n=1 Tax=Photobacterium iliopiscarium TaxID=56192 RepID=A0A2T3M7G8_9GAMM|nr:MULTISPECIES: hypothetical protein [Photobacterium]MCD9513119.1 hypothetical protein [Photobacterium phosphoreum]PST87343.1 hypothetical protein C9I86_13215 [Photobacterium sp. NCIMB 13483]PSV88145.1 hypothetical protein C9I88_19925 [Photobacterium iliopiscarium]